MIHPPGGASESITCTARHTAMGLLVMAASACAVNRIAVLVPCHRVLRADGGLGGYRWGLARKRTLIDRERARRNP